MTRPTAKPSTGSTSNANILIPALLATLLTHLPLVSAQSSGNCIADETINTEFAQLITGTDSYTVPEGSCCQETICGLGCPEEVPPPDKGFGIAVGCFMGLFVLIGLATYFKTKNQSVNYFVAGRSLSLFVVTLTLASQSLDSNAILGNVDLSYKYHFYDGACLPIGLGLSLVLNAIFFAGKINEDSAFTLPDVYAKRYGKTVEVMVSICTIISFLCLLAGNLVGMASLLRYMYDISQQGAIWLSAFVVLAYTITGGLFSVAYTDVVQSLIGWTGAFACAMYLLKNNRFYAPPPSVGYPGYSYPDDEVCQMYDGVPCTNLEGACCYNTEKYCSDPNDVTTCDPIDNGAYPIGDQLVIHEEMTSAYGLTPFPNAIVFNWATIFVLAFGNLAALDFQARCMAAKTPRTAIYGCFIAGCATFAIGIPFAYLGAVVRRHYGPDTARAVFETDTCSSILGLPTCALWVPDADAFIKMLTHEAPAFLGAWCLIAIIAASMSTCDGAILAMGTVFAHNIMRNMGETRFACRTFNQDHLLAMARVASVPLTCISAAIAAYYKSSHSLGATGYLLIVAFDVVLASVVVPLFGCFYTKKPSPLAALCAIITGSLTRIILEFALPKDGFLIAPFPGDEFLNYGSAASSAVPPFWDNPEEERWDSSAEPCNGERYNDFSGVDSLASPLVAMVVFIFVQFLERNGPIVQWKEDGWMAPYLKESQVVGNDQDPTKSARTADVSGRFENDIKDLDDDYEDEVVKEPVKEETAQAVEQ